MVVYFACVFILYSDLLCQHSDCFRFILVKADHIASANCLLFSAKHHPTDLRPRVAVAFHPQYNGDIMLYMKQKVKVVNHVTGQSAAALAFCAAQLLGLLYEPAMA